MDSSDTKTEGLGELRKRVDAIDEEIIELLLKRIELANSIMKSKPRSEIVDSAREREIIRRYSGKLADVSTPMRTERLVLAILAASSLYPES